MLPAAHGGSNLGRWLGSGLRTREAATLVAEASAGGAVSPQGRARRQSCVPEKDLAVPRARTRAWKGGELALGTGRQPGFAPAWDVPGAGGGALVQAEPVVPCEQAGRAPRTRGAVGGPGFGGRGSATHSDAPPCTLTRLVRTNPTWREATCRPRNQGRPGTWAPRISTMSPRRKASSSGPAARQSATASARPTAAEGGTRQGWVGVGGQPLPVLPGDPVAPAQRR